MAEPVDPNLVALVVLLGALAFALYGAGLIAYVRAARREAQQRRSRQ